MTEILAPSDVSPLNTDQLATIEEYVATINKLIAKNFIDNDTRIVLSHADIEGFFLENKKIQDEVISRIEEAGWNVRKYKNAKLGDFLSLSVSAL